MRHISPGSATSLTSRKASCEVWLARLLGVQLPQRARPVEVLAGTLQGAGLLPTCQGLLLLFKPTYVGPKEEGLNIGQNQKRVGSTFEGLQVPGNTMMLVVFCLNTQTPWDPPSLL